MLASGRREDRPLPIWSCGTNVRTRTAVQGVGAPGQPRAVRSVLNDFAVSARPPGFRWQERRPPSRLCAGAQRPLAPRPSGAHFRFGQLVAELESLRQTAAWKTAAARWWAWDHLPPRVRAPGCPGFACGAARRLGVSLPAPPAQAALGDPGVAVPRARAQTPRSLFLGFRSSGSAPPRPRSRPTFLEETTACVRSQSRHRDASPPPSQGLGCSGLPGGGGEQRGSSELGSCGLRGGARGGGPRGAADPSAAFPSPPRAAASSRCLGAGQEGRAGAGRWRLLPRKGPRNPSSGQEGRPTLSAALWLLEHRAGGSQPCFR